MEIWIFLFVKALFCSQILRDIEFVPVNSEREVNNIYTSYCSKLSWRGWRN